MTICFNIFLVTLRRPPVAFAAPQAVGAPAAEWNSAAGGAKISGNYFRCRIYQLFNALKKNSVVFCAAGPALTRGAGAPCLVSRATKPLAAFATLGRLRSSSPAPAALRSAYARAWSLRLPIANSTHPRLVSPPAPQAHPAALCFAVGLVPLASEPSGFLGGSGNLRLP